MTSSRAKYLSERAGAMGQADVALILGVWLASQRLSDVKCGTCEKNVFAAVVLAYKSG